jgi:hypothetical protein
LVCGISAFIISLARGCSETIGNAASYFKIMVSTFDLEIRADIEYILNNVPIVFKYLDCEGSKAMLSNSNLAFKNPVSFNDPYDCYIGLINFDRIPETYRQNLIARFSHLIDPSVLSVIQKELTLSSDERISKLFKDILWKREFSSAGISCFSEEFDNLLMWSHYSKSHTGACIGVDLRYMYGYLRERIPALIKVKYTDEFEKKDYFINTKDSLINCFRTKSALWHYEKEIRIVLFQLIFNQDNRCLIPFGKEIISTVYLGSKISPSDEKDILFICRKNYPKIKVHKMKLDDENSFSLIPQEINIES